METKSMIFEKSMETLKEAARRISSGEISIDEMAAVYKMGIEAADRGLSILNEVEGELSVISQKTEDLLTKEMESHDSGNTERKAETH